MLNIPVSLFDNITNTVVYSCIKQQPVVQYPSYVCNMFTKLIFLCIELLGTHTFYEYFIEVLHLTKNIFDDTG